MAKIEVIARAVMIRDGKILLCRDIAGDYAFLPGGHVEFGESSPDALRREMQEEAGIDVDVGALVHVCEQRFVQKGKERHEVTLMFHVEPVAGDVVSQESHISFTWADLASLADLDLRPAVTRAWLMADQGEPFITADARPAP